MDNIDFVACSCQELIPLELALFGGFCSEDCYNYWKALTLELGINTLGPLSPKLSPKQRRILNVERTDCKSKTREILVQENNKH